MASGKVQKALVLTQEAPHFLKLDTSYPIPVRKPGEVLVKVVSSSVNPIDAKLSSGAYKVDAFPKVIGGDVAGLVEEVEEGSKFKQGDAVFAMTLGFWLANHDGSYAEYATVPEGSLARVPGNLPIEEAGGVPLVALTAWQALIGANPLAGQKALILGASGGVGHIAVQLAKALGLYVVAVAGPANQDFLKHDLKADEVVNYRIQKLGELGTQFDIVLDLIGGETGRAAYGLLDKMEGYFAHVRNSGSGSQGFLGQIQEAAEKGEGPKVGVTVAAPNGEQLQQIADLIEEGKVKLVVAKTVPLDAEAITAVHQQLLAGTGIRGKVVVRV